MFRVTITPDGGEPFTIDAVTRDVLNWEKTTKGASLAKLRDSPSIQDIYRIAHFAARRTQTFTGELSEFEQTCDVDAELDEEKGEPDPTSADR